MNKHSLLCSNCGKIGHVYGRCPEPKISLGVLAYQYINNKHKYIMICRKHSMGFVEFIRGKYYLYSVSYIQNMFNEMTLTEKKMLLEKDFLELWNTIWYSELDEKIHCVRTKKQKKRI